MGFYIPEITMSKDPAVLFYYTDFLNGTKRMTFDQKGLYIELLCEQCDSKTGSISNEDFHFIIDPYEATYGDTYALKVLSKFEVDENGYFNSIMRTHINKRRKYTDSRKKNLKGTNTKTHMTTHMENEDVTVIENKIDNGNNNKEELTKIEKLFISTWQRKPKNLSEILAVEKMFLEYSEKHIIQAFRRAAEQDVLKVAYVKGILKIHYEKMASDKEIKEAKKKKLESRGIKI